jgi:hypothetical protein
VNAQWIDEVSGAVTIDRARSGRECCILTFDSDAENAQAHVLVEALAIYAERNPKYNDNWRRMGWRGVLIRIRERAERLWDEMWDAPPKGVWDSDDALDLINFAAFMVRAVEGETTRDGSWW